MDVDLWLSKNNEVKFLIKKSEVFESQHLIEVVNDKQCVHFQFCRASAPIVLSFNFWRFFS